MTSLFSQVPSDFHLLSVIATIIVMALLANWFVTLAFLRLERSKLTSSSVDKTALNFARRLASAVIYGVAIGACLTHIPELKIVGHSLLTGAGILTVMGGLASQQVLGNIVSGFMIVFFRPFRIGDRISLSGGYAGTVEDITLRETIVRDAENNRIIIPNSQVSSQVLINSNHTDSKVCKLIEVGVGYSSDLDEALRILQREILQHPLVIDQRTEEQKLHNAPIVTVRVKALGDSSITLGAWAWVNNPADGFVLQCDSLAKLKRAFDQAGIDLPFPQRTISFADGSRVITVNGAIPERTPRGTA
jgi:small conductance mechanosensitive channel